MGEQKRKKQLAKAGGAAGQLAAQPAAPGDAPRPPGAEAASAGVAPGGEETAVAGVRTAAAEDREGNVDEAEAAQPPLSGAPLPLTRLDAEWLGGFFELCFPDRQLIALCRALKISAPGYRLETLPPEQVARFLADEYLAAEEIRPQLEAPVREALRGPAFEGRGIPAEQLGEALEDAIDLMTGADPLQQLARLAWAALLGAPATGKTAHSAIDEGLLALQAPERPAKRKASLEEKEAQKAVAQAARSAEEASKRAERSERERESLARQLSAQRGAQAELEARLAEERSAGARLRQEQAQLLANLNRLTAAGDGRALTELRRAEAELRGLADKLARLEEAKAAAEARAEKAEKQLEAASQPRAQAAGAAADEQAALPSEEEAATFLLPVFTREFYDSIDRWSRRMQRAAFDKIHRLAEDWRHGSLRALALEGLPGYYRIRVATDVRLIYRREGNQLEILSLIDREDLDRYIRQARTR